MQAESVVVVAVTCQTSSICPRIVILLGFKCARVTPTPRPVLAPCTQNGLVLLLREYTAKETHLSFLCARNPYNKLEAELKAKPFLCEGARPCPHTKRRIVLHRGIRYCKIISLSACPRNAAMKNRQNDAMRRLVWGQGRFLTEIYDGSRSVLTQIYPQDLSCG